MATPIPENHAAFTAAELAFATGGALVRGAPETAIVGVTTDSRAVRAGNLFVAIRGEASDGHGYVEAAGRAGAAALLVAHGAAVRDLGSPENASVIEVDDTLVALGAIAAFHRRRWARAHDGVVVAITGSAGKTTTKELCAAALAAVLGDAGVLATRGNLNNRIGVPMTLLGLGEGHRVAVLELGTSLRGEIAALAAIAGPDVALLVNVGLAHAEGLAGAPRLESEPSWVGRATGREAVAREKGALLAAARSFAIACSDDAWASAALSLAGDRVSAFGFGRDARARYRLLDVAFEESGRPRVTLERPAHRPSQNDERARISFAVPLLGDVVALDAAGALAAADAALELLSADPVEAKLLEATFARRLRAVPGRLALRRRKDGALVLDDTYNASPDAFAASLDVARRLADGAKRRLVVVAGEMRELGDWSSKAHEDVGARVVSAKPELVITCGGAAEAIAEASVRAGIETLRGADARAAATLAADRISAGDLVLVKASRGVTAELVVDAILARGGEIPEGPVGRSDEPGRGGA